MSFLKEESTEGSDFCTFILKLSIGVQTFILLYANMQCIYANSFGVKLYATGLYSSPVLPCLPYLSGYIAM